MAGAEAAGDGKDTSNFADDKQEEAAAAHRNQSKEEEEDARKKKEEAEAALANAGSVTGKKMLLGRRKRKKMLARNKRKKMLARKRKRTRTYYCLEKYYYKVSDFVQKEWENWELRTKDEVDKMRKWLMLLATLAVSITYAAGLSPPGGMWQDDDNGHTAGTPVLQTIDRPRYLIFYYTNAMSFVSSLVIVALLLKREAKVQVLVFVTLLDLLCLELAYLAGTSASGLRLSIPHIVLASIAFLYIARGILVLVLGSALAVLIAVFIMGCLLFGKHQDEGTGNPDGGIAVTGSQQDDDRGDRV